MKQSKVLELSFAQQRLWLMDRLEIEASLYNIYMAFRCQGELNQQALELALKEVIGRHESLRTVFHEAEGKLTQSIGSSDTVYLATIDLSDRQESDAEREAMRRMQDETQRPFNLAEGPLLRTYLFQVEVDLHFFLVTMHHIISDGWSMGVFFKEISQLYRDFLENRSPSLPDLPIQYVDFARWQRDQQSGDRLEEGLAYWRKQLAGLPSALPLPLDRPRPTRSSGRGALYELTLEDNGRLDTLAKKNRTTLFAVLLGLFKILLSRYAGTQDVFVGVPSANRNRLELENLIGLFVNTLVLRSDLSGNPTFTELVQRVAKTSLEAFAHQDVPFDKLVEDLQPDRSHGHTPIFQVMFALQNAPSEGLELSNLEVTSLNLTGQTAKFDLTLSFVETSENLSCVFEYSTDLFDAATIERMAAHLKQLALHAVADPDAHIDSLEMLTEEEKSKILGEWNETTVDIPEGVLLKQMFEAQVERTPSATAVRFNGRGWTYRELNTQANRLAHQLRSFGVGPDVPVAMAMERSFEMVAALVAIIKAGGAYLALDLQSPKERLAFFLSDARPPVLLSQRSVLPWLPEHSAEVVLLESGDLAGPDLGNPSDLCLPQNLHSVVYTSGSTGLPKGTLTTADNYVDLLRWYGDFSGHSQDTRSLLATGLNFDANFRNVFSALLYGGCTVLASNQPFDANNVLETIASEGVTVVTCPPSFIHPIVDAAASSDFEKLTSMRYIHLGGEHLSCRKFRPWLESSNFNCTITNCYGLTEAADFSTSEIVEPGVLLNQETAPVGGPRQNHRIYIFDHNMRLQPVGVPGEIYVGGRGVTRCFLNRPALTAERFVPDPFDPGKRLYRTGDHAKWHSDGRLVFLGRVDHQVKIRGLRIELGEIEETLRQHPDVREVVAKVAELAADDKRIVAYICAKGDTAPSNEELRGFLKPLLPDFMVPTAFVELEAMPLNASGKIDRQRLPAVDWSLSQSSREYIAPKTETERQLVRICSELLGLERVGLNDNFFELGGHSLLAIRLISRIGTVFSVDLPLHHLFKAEDIADLAHILDESQTSSQETIQRIDRAPEVSESVLVPLTDTSDGQQLFVIHPVGGHVDCYGRLAALLGPSLSVFGLQSPDPDELSTDVGVEQLIDIYMEAVRKGQPKAPYYIAGWSMGAILALELGRRFREEGSEAHLILIDPTPPKTLPRTDDVPFLLWLFIELFGGFATQAGQGFTVALEEIRLLNELDDQLNYVLLKARMAKAVPMELDVAEFGRLFTVFRRNMQALERYEPTPCPGGAHLVYSETDNASSRSAWPPLFEQEPSIFGVPGNHYTCLQSPHVDALAKLIEQIVNHSPDGDPLSIRPDREAEIGAHDGVEVFR